MKRQRPIVCEAPLSVIREMPTLMQSSDIFRDARNKKKKAIRKHMLLSLAKIGCSYKSHAPLYDRKKKAIAPQKPHSEYGEQKLSYN